MLAINGLLIAQENVADYTSGSFTIYLNQSQKQTLLDTIKSRYQIQGCTLDSVVIDDQSPSTLDSAAYIVVYATCGDNSYSFGFFLTKEENHGSIIYSVNNNSASASKAWACQGVNCTSCKPERDWFLGPVTGCECKKAGGSGSSYCNHLISGGGLSIQDIIAILTFLIGLL